MLNEEFIDVSYASNDLLIDSVRCFLLVLDTIHILYPLNLHQVNSLIK